MTRQGVLWGLPYPCPGHEMPPLSQEGHGVLEMGVGPPHTGRCSGAPAGRMTEPSWEVASLGCQQENGKTADF